MPIIINCSKSFYEYLHPYVQWSIEEFWITALSSDSRIIRSKCLFRGTLDACPVFPRDLIKFLCINNAARFIISHSHPSGCSKPSADDDAVTQQILFLSEIIEIPLIDHIIVTELSYFSYCDKNWNGLKNFKKLRKT